MDWNTFLAQLMAFLNGNQGSKQSQSGSPASPGAQQDQGGKNGQRFYPGGIQSGVKSSLAQDPGYDPATQTALGGVNADYWNPSGGRLGADSSYEGPQIFQGYERNGQPVGNTSAMAGGTSPNPYYQQNLGNASYLAALLNMSPTNANPYGASLPNQTLLGNGPGALLQNSVGAQYHGDNPDMLAFLNRGSSLANMDASFAGNPGGVGGDWMNQSGGAGKWAE